MRKGTRHSAETINKMRLSKLGKGRGTFSIEWKEKMSLAKRGKHPNNFGVPRSDMARRRLSASVRGSKSTFWRHGNGYLHKTERQKAMNSVEYRIWRTTVFRRDNFTCVLCHTRGVRLNAWRQFPKLRYDIKNGRTLCEPCHRRTDTYGFISNNREQK